MQKLLILSFLILLFSGCSEKHFFESKVAITESGWNMNDIVKFSTEITDQNAQYSIYVTVEHDENYPYRNLWLFIRTTSPNDAFQIDTLNCYFTDENYNWLGKKSGKNRFVTTLFADSVSFYEQGVYTFEIQQALRQDIAPSLSEIGLIIDK